MGPRNELSSGTNISAVVAEMLDGSDITLLPSMDSVDCPVSQTSRSCSPAWLGLPRSVERASVETTLPRTKDSELVLPESWMVRLPSDSVDDGTLGSFVHNDRHFVACFACGCPLSTEGGVR